MKKFIVFWVLFNAASLLSRLLIEKVFSIDSFINILAILSVSDHLWNLEQKKDV